MTPSNLFKKWRERIEQTDSDSIAHKLMSEFIMDIHSIIMEPDENEIENRKLISTVAAQIRADIKSGKIPPIDLSDEE